MIHPGPLPLWCLEQADSGATDPEPDAVVVAPRDGTEDLLVKPGRRLRIGDVEQDVLDARWTEHGLLLKHDCVGHKGRRLEEAPAVLGRELGPDAVTIHDRGVTAAGVIAVGDTLRVEESVYPRHLDVSDGDRDMVGGEAF